MDHLSKLMMFLIWSSVKCLEIEFEYIEYDIGTYDDQTLLLVNI